MKSFGPSINKSSIYNIFSLTPHILNMSAAEISTSLSATGFAAFPAEIRAQIFWKTMDWERHFSTTSQGSQEHAILLRSA
jgi:hypothetical protein